MNICRRFLPPRNVKVAPARRAGADKHGMKRLIQERPHAVDALAEPGLDPKIEDIAGFLVDHLLGQPEAGYLAPDHAARARLAVEQDEFVAEWREVARNGERGRARADQRDPLTVRLRRSVRQEAPDVA